MVITDKHRKITDKLIKLKDGRIILAGKWLSDIALKLPQSFRYKAGKKKGELVDHFEELVDHFEEGGRGAVLKYVNDCYNLLNKAIEDHIARIL